MGIWPTIPIIVDYCNFIGTSVEDEIVAALEHPDRVTRINFFLNISELDDIAALMQEPFPVLTHLTVISKFGNVLVLPDGFLGGSAPSLQQLFLCGVQYPALPMLLLSASGLVNLRLRFIPSGNISLEAIVSSMAASNKLKTLDIHFGPRSSFPGIINSPPMTRTVLPALCDFTFSGECKYLEDFVSRIDAPQLDTISVIYQHRDITINFDVTQFSKFINRSENLKRSLSRHCGIKGDLYIVVLCVGGTASERWNPNPGISVSLVTRIEDQILRFTNILGFMSPILSDIVHWTINSVYFESGSGRDDLDWLQLFRQLSSVQTLFVFHNIAGLISRALAYVDVSTVTETLPALQLLCIEEMEEGEDTSSVHKFLAIRRDSGHPVTFVKTKEEFEERLESYP